MARSQCHHRPFPSKSIQSSPQSESTWGKAAGWRRGRIPVPELPRLPRGGGSCAPGWARGWPLHHRGCASGPRARLRDGTRVGGWKNPGRVGRQRDVWDLQGFGGCFDSVFPGKGLLQVAPSAHQPLRRDPRTQPDTQTRPRVADGLPRHPCQCCPPASSQNVH